MSELFLRLVNVSITAGWLILAVAAMRPLLKRAPKWLTCALWAVVAVRLVWPFSPESVLSLVPSAETVRPDILYAKTPAIESGVPAINRAVNPLLESSLSPSPAASVNPLQIWTTLAAWVWLAGMAALILYAVVSYGSLLRKVRVCLPLRGSAYLCDNIQTPFILGIVQPRIYLPSSLAEAEQTAVLAHEAAHLRRRDHWWKPLGFLLLAVYWFNPLCWLAYILLCRDIELACDEAVIRSLLPDGRIAYSEALLACSLPHSPVTACPLAFGEVGVKARIRSVLSYQKPAFWIILTAAAVCIALAVCFLTNPVKRPEADSKAVSSAAAAAADSQPPVGPASAAAAGSQPPVGPASAAERVSEASPRQDELSDPWRQAYLNFWDDTAPEIEKNGRIIAIGLFRSQFNSTPDLVVWQQESTYSVRFFTVGEMVYQYPANIRDGVPPEQSDSVLFAEDNRSLNRSEVLAFLSSWQPGSAPDETPDTPAYSVSDADITVSQTPGPFITRPDFDPQARVTEDEMVSLHGYRIGMSFAETQKLYALPQSMVDYAAEREDPIACKFKIHLGNIVYTFFPPYGVPVGDYDRYLLQGIAYGRFDSCTEPENLCVLRNIHIGDGIGDVLKSLPGDHVPRMWAIDEIYGSADQPNSAWFSYQTELGFYYLYINGETLSMQMTFGSSGKLMDASVSVLQLKD
jgi:beta-lactamase regulating signal transducer with metallopeptidase domain